MDAQKVLFPTDFSDESHVALRQAATLAGKGGLVLILHVEEPPETFTDVGFAGYSAPANEADVRSALEKVVPPFENVRYEHLLLNGHPADEIVACAEAQGVDMIVMGTHGRTGLTRVLMGSIAESVVRRATCPVLTVKNRKSESAPT